MLDLINLASFELVSTVADYQWISAASSKLSWLNISFSSHSITLIWNARLVWNVAFLRYLIDNSRKSKKSHLACQKSVTIGHNKTFAPYYGREDKTGLGSQILIYKNWYQSLNKLTCKSCMLSIFLLYIWYCRENTEILGKTMVFPVPFLQ